MPRRILRTLAAAAALPLLAACQTGLIYTHVTEPLSTNFDKTKVFAEPNEVAKGDVKHVSVPVLDGVSVDVTWNSNAIGDVAQRNGIDEIWYADLETLSILTIWNQYTVHVYGKAKAGS